jgi:hypothetical protein
MERAGISCLRLVTSVPRQRRLAGEDLLLAEHPTVAVVRTPHPGASDPIVDANAWMSLERFRDFDDAVLRSSSTALSVCGSAVDVCLVAVQALTRWQRFIRRRNPASHSPMFDAALLAHAELHDVSKPLVRADLDHAVDTWQWMLRLAPEASCAVQLAALFHDVERLETEADARVEHHAPDYAAFKDAHASRGGERAREVLIRAGVDEKTAKRVRDIVALHERRGHDPETDLLNDADGLSFFSLNSSGYADYFGPQQTRKKVAYTLARLSGVARRRLSTTVRLRPDVEAHLDACMT